jgi:hypothetical protein
MWTFFYKSTSKLYDIATQINPNLKAEFTSFIENEGEFDANIEGKTSAILNNIINLSAKIGGRKRKKETTEIKGVINENSFINSLDRFFPKSKYSVINKEFKIDNIKELKKLIYFSGSFKILIDGKDSFEKIANFKDQDFIKWSGSVNGIKLNLLTSRANYLSTELPPTAVAQALSTRNSTVNIDGFGTLLNVDNKTIEISPLFIGHKFDL